MYSSIIQQGDTHLPGGQMEGEISEDVYPSTVGDRVIGRLR